MEKNNYSIKSLNKTKNMLHVKINNTLPYPIVRREVILLNGLYLELTPYDDGKINLNSLGNPNDTGKASTYKISSSFTKFDKLITIGRDRSCSLPLAGDKTFSKINTSLKYDFETNNWVLHDGEFNKPSTNGTWLYCTHSFEILESTHFLFGGSTFSIKMQY